MSVPVVVEEFSVVMRAECLGPMTKDQILDARCALAVLCRDAFHVRAHPTDVAEWWNEVGADGVYMSPDGALQWSGLFIHRDASMAPGHWSVETARRTERRVVERR